MSFATVFPKSPIRILVHGPLAARRRTGDNGRGRVRRSRYRVTWLWRVSVPASTAIGVYITVLSAVEPCSVGASPRTVRVSGLSVVVLRSNFAILQGRGGKEPSTKPSIGQ